MAAYADVAQAYVRACEVERQAIEDAGEPPKGGAASRSRPEVG